MVATAVSVDPAALPGLARSLTSSQWILLALTDANNTVLDDVTGPSLGSSLTRGTSDGVDVEFRLYQPAGQSLRRVELSGGALDKVIFTIRVSLTRVLDLKPLPKTCRDRPMTVPSAWWPPWTWRPSDGGVYGLALNPKDIATH